MHKKSKDLCRGCRDDYYNGQGAEECWSYKTAEPVRRWRIGWWTQPDSSEAFTHVETLACHNAPGKYGHYECLPEHLGSTKA